MVLTLGRGKDSMNLPCQKILNLKNSNLKTQAQEGKTQPEYPYHTPIH